MLAGTPSLLSTNHSTTPATIVTTARNSDSSRLMTKTDHGSRRRIASLALRLRTGRGVPGAGRGVRPGATVSAPVPSEPATAELAAGRGVEPDRAAAPGSAPGAATAAVGAALVAAVGVPLLGPGALEPGT